MQRKMLNEMTAEEQNQFLNSAILFGLKLGFKATIVMFSLIGMWSTAYFFTHLN